MKGSHIKRFLKTGKMLSRACKMYVMLIIPLLSGTNKHKSKKMLPCSVLPPKGSMANDSEMQPWVKMF